MEAALSDFLVFNINTPASSTTLLKIRWMSENAEINSPNDIPSGGVEAESIHNCKIGPVASERSGKITSPTPNTRYPAS